MHKDRHDELVAPVLQFKQGINLSVLPPLLSREHFAAFTGTSLDTVRGWIQTSTIPSVKIGRQRLINISLLTRDLEGGKTSFSQGDYENL